MGKFYDEIPDFLAKWIEKQHMFCVATAPLSADGRVNVSSKGLEGTFHVVDPHTVWYEDLTGSGVETISHIRENGRITILFNAFDGPPRIARLFGTGEVYEFGTPEYDGYIPVERRKPALRSVILVHIHKVGTSCGYGVPLYEFKRHRETLVQFAEKAEAVDRACDPAEKPVGGIRAYWTENNTKSIDGLPGLHTAHNSTIPFQSVYPTIKTESTLAQANRTPMIPAALGFVAGALLTAVAVHLT